MDIIILITKIVITGLQQEVVLKKGGEMMRASGLVGLIVRFIVSALVLMLVSFLLPGFAALTFGQALIAAVIIAVLGYIVESLFGKRVSPQNRGIVGFLTAAVVIYISQFIVPGMSISILGALLAAVVIGVIDLFVPTELR
jgi:putative membrane protein